MWEKWKQKVKDLFTVVEEVEEDEQQEIQHEQNRSNLQAKMMYQYPDNKSFRFPVIPDKKVEKKVMKDTTSYQSKRDNNNRSKKHDNSNNRNSNDDRKNKQQIKSQFGKVYKKDGSTPFKLTEVPSPIYGFQQRQREKELENIPAFKRKQQILDELTDNEPVNDVKLISNDAEQEPEHVNHMEEQASTLETEKMEKELPAVITTSDETREKRENIKTTPAVERKWHKGNQKNTQQKQQVPFNVIMTPRDKKNQFDRKAKQREDATVTQVSQTVVRQAIPFHLLNDPVQKSNDDQIWVQGQQELLEKTLKHFNVGAKVVNATQGPSVTRFEVQPELGVKVSKVKNLSDDLKLNMSARDIRIEAPIPGKNTIGIEIPNRTSQMVGLQGIFEAEQFKQSKSPLTIALGLSIEGLPIITNIQKMPHGLIAGATGSGKSVCINTILISLLYKASHDDVKFLLIDPKMVELAPYNGIPHLVAPVITDVKAATAALKWAVNEMEDRYEKFVQEGVRDIERYNQKVLQQNRVADKMPFIVIVIDELADLMMISPQDVEDAISRIAQKARACGIHLLLATQRPSVDVITGLIKANIPTRIAFSVSSQVDSRTIIDSSGAEKLLGKGDMLFVENGAGKSVRLQGPFVSDEEIERVTNHARSIAAPNYLFEQEQLLEQIHLDEEEDVLLQDAIQFILQQNSASTSLLQRQFKIGYNRAARLIDTLEQKGIISGQNGSKPREVLVTQTQLEEM